MLDYKIHHHQNVLRIPRAQYDEDNREHFSHCRLRGANNGAS